MIRLAFYTLLLSFTLLSCQNGEEGSQKVQFFNNDVLPGANGGILDLLVVADDPVWDGAVGDAFRKEFTAMTYGLPQPEPRFTVRQVESRDFNELLQRSRYLVLLGLDDTARFSYEENRWAKGQLVVHLLAPDQKQLRKLVLLKNKEILAEIEARERKRLSTKIQPLTLKEYPPFFEENGLKLPIPRDFELSVSQDDLVVYWKRTTRADVGIMIHVAPLPQNNAILGSELVPLRDSLTKLYVPGSKEGSYMITEDIIKPNIEATEIDGRFALEVRGLWRTVGDIMGGPFVAYGIYDEENQRLIYIDTFILAPSKKKRRSLFELESTLHELQILD